MDTLIIQPDKVTNDTQLSDELIAAGFTCRIAHLSRELGPNGRVVLRDGKPKRIPRYIRLVCNEEINPGDIATLRTIVINHVPQGG